MSAHPPQVISIHCKCKDLHCGHDIPCGDEIRVVKGSKAHKEGICNLCIYAQILASTR